MIYVGTPPDETAVGTVFRGIRDKALAKKTKTTAWFEFSVKEMTGIEDPEKWAETNPALGRRMLLSTIEAEFEQMPPDKFARERLGWWSPNIIERVDYAIPSKIWDACRSADPKPEGKIAYGVKFSADGSAVCLCGAVIPENGAARISMIEYKSTASGTQWLADWLNDRYMKASCVVIDGRNGVDVLIDKIIDTWRMKGAIVRPSVKDVIAGVSMLTDALGEKTVTWYEKQEALRESAVTSVKRPISGGWGFGGDNSLPVEACALAYFGAKTSKRDPNRRMRIG